MQHYLTTGYDAAPVVVYNSGGIGDQLLAVPALRALRSIFGTRLRVLCVSGVGDLLFSRLSNIESIETQFFYNYAGKVTGIGLPSLARSSPEGKSDIISPQHDWAVHSPWTFDHELIARKLGHTEILISLTPWHSQAFERLCNDLRPSQTIAYNSGHTISLPCDGDRHFADECFACPAAISSGLSIEAFWGGPLLSEHASRRACNILRRFSHGNRVLGIHCETKADKEWSEEAFLAVALRFLERNPDYIVVLVGTHFNECWNHHPRVFPCIPLDLATSLALIANCDLFLGIDSCMVHCADIHSVPSVGLFLASASRRYGLRFAAGETLKETHMNLFREDVVLTALEATAGSVRKVHWYTGARSPIGELSDWKTG